MARSRLEQIFREHSDVAWRVLRRCGLDAAGADDALQQVFLVVGARLGDIAPGCERSFVCSVAVKLASRQRVLARREQPVAGLSPEPVAACSADELYDQQKRRELLDATLGQLDERLRAVLVLAEVEGLSKREVALALEIPEGTVASRLRRAKAGFRARLGRLRYAAAFFSSTRSL